MGMSVTAEDMIIRAERGADRPSIRELLTLAFGDGGRVADLVDALRAARTPLPVQSFVAEAAGRAVGHVMLSASWLDAPPRLLDVYVLSPLSVLPEFQRNGIGGRLVAHATATASTTGVPLVFLEGSPDYYGKRGFERADALGFRSPSLRIPPPAFQVALLSGYESWMTGTLVYAETFWAHDCVGLREPELRQQHCHVQLVDEPAVNPQAFAPVAFNREAGPLVECPRPVVVRHHGQLDPVHAVGCRPGPRRAEQAGANASAGCLGNDPDHQVRGRPVAAEFAASQLNVSDQVAVGLGDDHHRVPGRCEIG